MILVLLPNSAAKARSPLDVSMIQLIANPQQFNGRQVRLIAYLRLEFEGDALYLHREDFTRGMTSNALWIALDDKQLKASRTLNNGYVLVEGVFSSTDKGHLGMFSGAIDQVTRLQAWKAARR